MAKLDVKALGIAFGATWGLAVLFAGWLAMLGWGTSLVAGLGSIYVGYSATFFGAIVGAIWGFIDGFLGGVVIAWIYNKVAK